MHSAGSPSPYAWSLPGPFCKLLLFLPVYARKLAMPPLLTQIAASKVPQPTCAEATDSRLRLASLCQADRFMILFGLHFHAGQQAGTILRPVVGKVWCAGRQAFVARRAHPPFHRCAFSAAMADCKGSPCVRRPSLTCSPAPSPSSGVYSSVPPAMPQALTKGRSFELSDHIMLSAAL